MPSPYRRSCRDCVKAKRRCDLNFPCYRCRVRSLQCTYESPLNTRPIAVPDVADDEDSTSTVSPPSVSWTNAAEMPDVNPAVGPLDVYNNAPVGLTLTGSTLPFFPDYDLDWPDIMENIDRFAAPDQVGVDNSVPSRSVLAGEIYQERIISAVKQFKSWPGMYASRGHIPFIHARLYKNHLPLAMQEALGMCSLYTQRNSHNEHLVNRCISQAARRLITEHCESDNMSPIEQLASAQALCLYQIIQLFDGDIALRSQAEVAGPVLDRWLRKLKCHAKPVSDALTNLIHTAHAHDAWQTWVFDECVRRTLIVGFSIEGLYSFLKNGWDASHHDFAELGFYAQRALWTAPSEYFWLAALTDHLLLPVWFRTWESDIAQAQPADMEELGVIMMGFIKGMDYCRHWLGKEELHKFGLTLHELGSPPNN
ncbi:hypothetical protein N7509_003992 [Penicillium cosmopolitanum]|uniref:Zn(2)-C6 fungal-type domain-containing protein n=1 Tax=Penicillium cosmopolitanum TaxID=1131564 RepID=A0A9W9W6C1_9EURO|nr:uncharacterized protein N7509_003992 [Penicillium cosmopolitanum]KAJ5404121.1 hypothetical protein N7509_003992 [Penicillium cosmopolitanum]